MCNLRMNYLSPSIAYAYGVLSIPACIIATFGNIIVLKILWSPNTKFKSSKILTSLAISDLSVGLILLPLFFVELLYQDLMFNCAYDYAREYITTVTIGSSLLALGIVSYDRYILMTVAARYNEIMNKRKIIILITSSWVVPAVSPSLRFIGLGKGPFLYFVIVLTLGPLIVLMFTYYKILQVIQQSSLRIAAHTDNNVKKKDKTLKSVQVELRSVKKQPSRSHNEVYPVGKQSHNAYVIPTKSEITLEEKEKKRSSSKSIKLAKTVSLLILVYIGCSLPSSIWSISDLINEEKNFTKPWVIQNMYIFACFAASMNSCFNPIIYFFKQPGMKREFLKTFGFRLQEQHGSSKSHDSQG